MKKLADFIAARTWVVVVVPILIVIVALSSTSDSSGNTIAIVVFVTIATLTLLTLGLNLSGFDPRSAELAEALAPSGLRRQLIERWLRRSRYYRYIAAAIGVILGAGFVNNGELTPVLLGALAGIALGGGLAELHILRRRDGGARTAELTVRRVSDYTNRVDTTMMGAVVVASLVVGALSIAGVADGGRRPLALALIAIAIITATAALQYLVVTRSRPAVNAELRDADDLLRYLAATQGFARPAIAVALISLAYAIAAFSTAGSLNLLALVVGGLGVIWYVRSRQPAIHRLIEVAA